MNYKKRLMLESATTGTNPVLAGGFNDGTGISIDIPDFNFDNPIGIDTPDFNHDTPSGTGTSTNTSTGTGTGTGGGFFSGFNLNGLLNTLLKGGMTWAQIEAAKNGKDVYVQGSGGNKENITPMLISKFNEQAAAQQKTTTEILKTMQAQMSLNNANAPAKKDNTLKYIGIGVGALVLVGGGILLINSNKKKSK
ncbi:hypothetical protein [Tenacibaculum sp. nBUS_03]|uniref:hypothetical protein n=1 Tax=Tenacibaculum sp. nBUS_03 TaxID=3395320 RepID=UPI003EB76EC3